MPCRKMVITRHMCSLQSCMLKQIGYWRQNHTTLSTYRCIKEKSTYFPRQPLSSIHYQNDENLWPHPQQQEATRDEQKLGVSFVDCTMSLEQGGVELNEIKNGRGSISTDKSKEKVTMNFSYTYSFWCFDMHVYKYNSYYNKYVYHKQCPQSLTVTGIIWLTSSKRFYATMTNCPQIEQFFDITLYES